MFVLMKTVKFICMGRHEGIANIEIYRDKQGQKGSGRDGQRQAGTGRDRQRQAGTGRDRQGLTRTSREKHEQTGRDGDNILHFSFMGEIVKVQKDKDFKNYLQPFE